MLQAPPTNLWTNYLVRAKAKLRLKASKASNFVVDFQTLICVIHRHPFNYTGCLWTEKSNKDYGG